MIECYCNCTVQYKLTNEHSLAFKIQMNNLFKPHFPFAHTFHQNIKGCVPLNACLPLVVDIKSFKK